MRAALIRDDVADNVIEATEGYEPPEGFTLRWLDDDEIVGPGWRLVQEQWQPPQQPDPILPTDPIPDPVAQMRSDLDWLITYVMTGEA